MKTASKDKKMPVINDRKEIPNFKSDAEAAEFWANHSVGEGLLMDTYDPDFDAPLERSHFRPADATTAISLRLERDLKTRLVALAKAKGMAYQTLLKQFVAERVYEEEKRMGVVK